MATKQVDPAFLADEIETNPEKEVIRQSVVATLILVADQHTEVINGLRETLSGADYALLHARDGKQAIALLEKLNVEIKLAIIELELPAPNGFDLIGILTRKELKPIKIIAITSRYSEIPVDQIKAIGADALLRKPITRQRWVETVQSVLSA